MDARVLASPSRRNFLTATTAIGGGLLLGFGLPARGEIRDSLTTGAPFAPNAFLRIDRAGKVTFVSPMIEMGQGTYTSLPMLIAEELEVDVDKVAIEHAPPDARLCQSARRRPDDRRVDRHPRDVRPAAPRGRDGAGHAGDGGRAALEGRSVHMSRGERHGGACAHRSQGGLRRSRRRRREAAGAGEGGHQGARRVQARRKAAPAPRHRRQAQRHRQVRHRYPAAGDEVRGGRRFTDLRREAPLRRRGKGEGRARREPGRPARRRSGDRRQSYLGRQARTRRRRCAVGPRPEREALAGGHRRPARFSVGKARRGGAP